MCAHTKNTCPITAEHQMAEQVKRGMATVDLAGSFTLTLGLSSFSRIRVL